MLSVGELKLESLWAYLLSIDALDELSNEGRQREFYDRLLRVAEWPPDVFCLVAAVLRLPGAHAWLGLEKLADLQKEAEINGLAWQEEIGSNAPLKDKPHTLQAFGDLIYISGVPNLPHFLPSYIKYPDLVRRLAGLLMKADFACTGFGLPLAQDGRSYYRTARHLADLQLVPGAFGSTLCREILPGKARVLPKTHTPPSGRTLRSLSHNVCYVESGDGQPLWYTVPGPLEPTNRLNMLLVPYPPIVPSGCFADQGELAGEGHSAFSFQPVDTCGRAAHEICSLVARAGRMAGPVNVVVLPELALCLSDYSLLRNYLLSRNITLIAGLGGVTQDGQEENRLCLDVPLSSTHAVHFRQRKHHPWKLHPRQILQYELSNDLDPSRTYWEKIQIGDRNTYFIALHPRILASVLICEDLAQYEPVGRLIRSIGPNLVVALLLDGPQLAGRWPERYAAVLTDDPGSSVLTLTCYGMSRRSRARRPGADKSGIIALWKDPDVKREIELDRDASAVLLTLTVKEQDEWTADLRRRKAVSLRLAQWLQVASDGPGLVDESWFDECKPRPDITFIAPVEASALARLARLKKESPKDDWARYYVEAVSRLGVEGRKIARHMLEDDYGLTDMGPEEKREAEILARCGVSWREHQKSYYAEKATAREIIRWAEALRKRR